VHDKRLAARAVRWRVIAPAIPALVTAWLEPAAAGRIRALATGRLEEQIASAAAIYREAQVVIAMRLAAAQEATADRVRGRMAAAAHRVWELGVVVLGVPGEAAVEGAGSWTRITAKESKERRWNLGL